MLNPCGNRLSFPWKTPPPSICPRNRHMEALNWIGKSKYFAETPCPHRFSEPHFIHSLFDFFPTSITKIQTFSRILACDCSLNLFHDFTVPINALYTINLSIFGVITHGLFSLGHGLAPFVQFSFAFLSSLADNFNERPKLLLPKCHFFRKQPGQVSLLYHGKVGGVPRRKQITPQEIP